METAKEDAQVNEPTSDPMGYLIVSLAPIVFLATLLVGLSPFRVMALLTAAALVLDAPRWGLPRLLWGPLGFLWPIAIPGYVIVRRLNGARVHWSLGFISIAVAYWLFTLAHPGG